MEQATCRSCVDACPTAAWVIDEERLGIDTGRCDGCGLCAPACPEGAVDLSFPSTRWHIDGVWVAFAACDRAETQSGDANGCIPCLHAIGVSQLLRLHGDGVRRLILARGDCDDCPRGGVSRIDQSLDRVNALLANRGLALIQSRVLPSQRWSLAIRAAKAQHRPPKLGRRAFFSGILSGAVETALELSERQRPEVSDFVPPGRLVPGTGGLALHAPHIDATLCNGCDACGRLCPHDAIRVEPHAYVLDPDGCTGCGICVDVCEPGAVSIRSMDTDPQGRLTLHRRRCTACGVDFHTPSPPTGRGDPCPICARTQHHRQLYQVHAQ